MTELLTDPLTGLGSRDKLLSDLERAVRPDSMPSLLVLFALDGFSEYLELYGRLRGHILLVTLGRRLETVVGRAGTCYRQREGEFGSLLNVPISETKALLDGSLRALRQREEGIALRAAYGAAMLPDEAGDPIGALQLADQRLSSNAPRRRARNRRS